MNSTLLINGKSLLLQSRAEVCRKQRTAWTKPSQCPGQHRGLHMVVPWPAGAFCCENNPRRSIRKQHLPPSLHLQGMEGYVMGTILLWMRGKWKSKVGRNILNFCFSKALFKEKSSKNSEKTTLKRWKQLWPVWLRSRLKGLRFNSAQGHIAQLQAPSLSLSAVRVGV